MQCFIMFVFGIVAFHVGNGVGGTEACQGVDMTVGIIAGQITVIQPAFLLILLQRHQVYNSRH